MRKLTAKDFPNKAFMGRKIPATQDNFNILLKQHNELVDKINHLMKFCPVKEN